MNEKLLQYIWKFQYYNKGELFTQAGEMLQIIDPGKLNSNQGPDFLDAKIKIDQTLWAGNIELHILSSDWNLHQHNNDLNYRNVILHVVWRDDVPLNQPFPVLELQSRISNMLLHKYSEMMQSDLFIPCEKAITQINALTWQSWKERLLIERLLEKSKQVLTCCIENNYHWEETFWWLLAKGFGVKVNSESFEKIARSIPLTLLAKHKGQVQQIECLLFGQAGMLTGKFKDQYFVLLQKEYRFLSKKYGLQPVNFPLHFLRMRPSNFPTIRLAQLAMLVHDSHHLFAKILEAVHLRDIKKLLDVTANDYWHYRYLPDEEAPFKEKKLGSQMIDSLLINTILPVLFAYGAYKKEAAIQEKSVQWFSELAAEENRITKGFEAIGVAVKTAVDSQALLQLRNHYCNEKRCLECAIGNAIFRQQKSNVAPAVRNK